MKSNPSPSPSVSAPLVPLAPPVGVSGGSFGIQSCKCLACGLVHSWSSRDQSSNMTKCPSCGDVRYEETAAPAVSVPSVQPVAVPAFPRLKVVADPLLAGVHPFHDSRYIATEDADFEQRDVEGERDEFNLVSGSLVCSMRDLHNQAEFAAFIVTACNSHAANLAKIKALEEALSQMVEAYGCECVQGHLHEGIQCPHCTARAALALPSA